MPSTGRKKHARVRGRLLSSTLCHGDSSVAVRNWCVRIWPGVCAAVLAILHAGPVDAATKVVYDSTNFSTVGADGYGILGITSPFQTASFGDSLHLTATGRLTSFTWAAFNGSGSTADLTSASQTISFYRQSDASLIGSFNATITDLARGAFKTYTADLGSANIVLDTPDILVTQQIPYWPPGTPTYRLGIPIATASNTPAIGSTTAGYYRLLPTGAGTFMTDPSYPNYSSAVYQAVVLPDVTWNTTSGTWNTSTANWTTGSGPREAFSDGSQATFNNASGGVVILSGALAPRAVVVSATGGNYAFVSTAGNQITGAATLSKSGAGTLLLYGTNTYSGATTVSAGKLLVNGSLANSAVTVGNGGTLGGTGPFGNLVTVQSGGVLSPGNSPGALAAAALDLQAGSTTFMEIVGSGSAAGVAGSDYDQVQITTSGGLTYGGTLNLEFGIGSSFANGTSFDLFAFSGSPVGHFSSVVSSGSGVYAGRTFSGAGGIWTSVAGGQQLTFSELTGRLTFALAAVPEIDPATGSSAVTLVAGVLAILEQRRRRAKAAA